MTIETVRVINTITGAEGKIARHIFENPVFGAVLVELTPDAKKFVPELYQPQTPEVFEDRHEDKVVSRRRKNRDNPTEEIQEEG